MTREEIQEIALQTAMGHKKCSIALSMGVGKTLVGLKWIEKHGFTGDAWKVLVVAPKKPIFDTWKAEAAKFGYSHFLDRMEFVTYLSLNKKNPGSYDLVILDECHSLKLSHSLFLDVFTGPVLGLTGTPPKWSKSEKGMMLNRYCPVKYRYIMDEAVNDDILNDYRILVHRIPLSSNPYGHTVKASKGSYPTSETKHYDYLSRRCSLAQTYKQKQMSNIMRMRALMEFKTKERYVQHLVEDLDEKCIIFCNTTEQADRMCKDSVHTKNPESGRILQDFIDGGLNRISCVLKISEGTNMPGSRVGVIMHSYGNETKSAQRIGRVLRLEADDVAVIHILCYSGTVDEKWVKEALSGLDDSKIIYYDVNPATYESTVFHG